MRRAGLHMVLGNALQTLGERESGTERLEQAVAAYNAALEEYTRERVPLDWAMTQHNLGTALQTLGEREGDTDLLERAVNAHKAALEVKWPDRGDYLRSNAVSELANYILRVLKKPIVWVVGALFVPWLSGIFNSYMPSPQQALLGAKNSGEKVWHYVQPQPPLSEERFHVVLSWLEGDGSGKGAKSVEGAFRDIAGVHLSRSAHIVKASGAKDNWVPAMRKRAREILVDWQADLAIVGEVKEPKKVLSLWFVPRVGDGTLSRGDRGSNYVLENVTLGDDFRKEFRAQIAAMALSAVAPLVSDEACGKVLDDGLSMVAKQLANLLGSKNSPIVDSGRRAGLYVALGNALSTLGKCESGTGRLEQAVAAYKEALEEYTRDRVPLDWAMAQNNLGAALATLGERESGTESLEQAVVAYNVALEEYTRERVPLDWATTQNNLGNALRVLGERESAPKRLKQAVAAYKAALEERTRKRVPFDWAATQNNLGNALATLGERESGTDHLEQAVVAYNAALEEHTRERVPLDWATTQNNLGDALIDLGPARKQHRAPRTGRCCLQRGT